MLNDYAAIFDFARPEVLIRHMVVQRREQQQTPSFQLGGLQICCCCCCSFLSPAASTNTQCPFSCCLLFDFFLGNGRHSGKYWPLVLWLNRVFARQPSLCKTTPLSFLFLFFVGLIDSKYWLLSLWGTQVLLTSHSYSHLDVSAIVDSTKWLLEGGKMKDWKNKARCCCHGSKKKASNVGALTWQNTKTFFWTILRTVWGYVNCYSELACWCLRWITIDVPFQSCLMKTLSQVTLLTRKLWNL